jgi:hypothetical protein
MTISKILANRKTARFRYGAIKRPKLNDPLKIFNQSLKRFRLRRKLLGGRCRFFGGGGVLLG